MARFEGGGVGYSFFLRLGAWKMGGIWRVGMQLLCAYAGLFSAKEERHVVYGGNL
jgi:hypothetical protein